MGPNFFGRISRKTLGLEVMDEWKKDAFLTFFFAFSSYSSSHNRSSLTQSHMRDDEWK